MRRHLMVTFNPDEAWTHPQHFGLARCVRDWLDPVEFDSRGQFRATLHGIREHAWYQTPDARSAA